MNIYLQTDIFLKYVAYYIYLTPFLYSSPPTDALVLDKQISLSKYKNLAATPHLNWLFFYSLLFFCQIMQGDESGHEMS